MILQILLTVFMWIAILCAASSLFPSVFEERVIKVDQKRKAQNSDFIFIIFAAIGWLIIYYNAVYGCLWFISEDAGYINSEGDWTAIRAGLAGTGSLWLTGITYMQLKRLNISEIQLRQRKEEESS